MRLSLAIFLRMNNSDSCFNFGSDVSNIARRRSYPNFCELCPRNPSNLTIWSLNSLRGGGGLGETSGVGGATLRINYVADNSAVAHRVGKAVPFVELTVAHASVLTILAISFERYYAICEPLRAGYVCTKARATFLCFLAWVAAALCTSPILLMVTYELEENVDGTYTPTCTTPASTTWMTGFILTTIIVFFVIPLLILIVLYTVIARHLMANPAISRGPANNLLKYRKQVVMMLATVVLCFFLCLLPFKAFTLWIIIVPPKMLVSLGIEGYFSLLYFCRVMLYLNSAINPILYNLMSTKFREGFLKLCGLGPAKRKKKKTSDRAGTYTTGSTNCSSSHSDFWRRHSSNRSCSVKGSEIRYSADGISDKVRRQKQDIVKSRHKSENEITNFVHSSEIN
ncbi:PREDICTED: growth hormone secretagogue receptor type 1 isoform X3 [Wasmannia auropunctata]|uniref:growth hormone secretagogue receptor type 1 isoform X3 n=1 Tax=Wasmannia auropunctata TaxID=64793 RepID=UPI0005ED9233|nr:PREDICTED: growth hormone secretagogue receptor type 1 isoform X3 [Wasmannia auropunctata]